MINKASVRYKHSRWFDKPVSSWPLWTWNSPAWLSKKEQAWWLCQSTFADFSSPITVAHWHSHARLPHLLAGSCVLNSGSGGYILLRLPRACSWIPAGVPYSGRLGGGKVGCEEGDEPLYPPAKCWESWRPKCFLEID